jgi:hypothetical protein
LEYAWRGSNEAPGLLRSGVLKERALFIAALQKDEQVGQAAYSTAACGHDADLPQCVEHLLRLHEDVCSYDAGTPSSSSGAASDGACFSYYQ